MDDLHDEDKKVLEYALDKLLEESEHDISSFQCDMDTEYDDFTWDDDEDMDDADKHWFKGPSKCFRFTWTKSHSFSIKYLPAMGTVSIYTSGRMHIEREINVGLGPANKDIKIAIMKIWHKVNDWWAVEEPRREREKYVNEMMRVFPDIFDSLILGGEDDEEED